MKEEIGDFEAKTGSQNFIQIVLVKFSFGNLEARVRRQVVWSTYSIYIELFLLIIIGFNVYPDNPNSFKSIFHPFKL